MTPDTISWQFYKVSRVSLLQHIALLRGTKTYLRVGVSTDDDLNRTRTALTQNRVDVIQRHATNHRVINLHDLIATPDRRIDKEKSNVWNNGIWHWVCMISTLNVHPCGPLIPARAYECRFLDSNRLKVRSTDQYLNLHQTLRKYKTHTFTL